MNTKQPTPAPQQPAPTDGELVDSALRMAQDGYYTESKKRLLTRLASLAQQVENAQHGYVEQAYEIENLKGERDALRKVLWWIAKTAPQAYHDREPAFIMAEMQKAASAALALPAPTTEGGDCEKV